MAGGSMVSAIQSHPELYMAGAAEPHPDVRSSFAKENGAPVFSSPEELLDSVELDAVYIATPHQLHREHALLAADAGKHIIVEKPMALSLPDCDAMIAAAAAHNIVLIVGHTHSFDPAVLTMRELIHNGGYGSVVSLALLNYTDFLYRPRRPEELDTSAGGGVLFNQIPHQVDIARLLVDAPVRSVRAATNRLDARRPTEGGCTALVMFEGGAVCSLVYQGYDRYDSDELQGWINEAGYPKRADPGAARRKLRELPSDTTESARRRSHFGYGSRFNRERPPHQPHFGFLVVSCQKADLRPTADGISIFTDEGMHQVDIPKSPWKPGRGDVLQELCRCVRDSTPPLHDGAFGRSTLEVSLAIQQSARERREIGLPLESYAS
jgi:phthalate 4,5-cis-dihydrodiol dehydrogenase